MTTKETWPKSYKCRFIEPGLVHYNEYGTVLVGKPVLDTMLNSFVGKPVIDETHKEVNPSIYSDGGADGIVTKVWYSNDDGWYWAEYLVWNPTTQQHCESGDYSVSCAYSADKFSSSGGRHNSISYDQEILAGVYDHLAVVSNPRYEGARIVYNSKGGTAMFLSFLKNKQEKERIDIENATVEIDGKEVSVKDLIKTHNDATASHPTSSIMSQIGGEWMVQVDGKPVPLKDMTNAYKEKLKNDEDDKKKKDEEDRKNAEDKKKEDEEKDKMKNAHEKGEHVSSIQNCAMCTSPEGQKHFKNLDDAAKLRGEPQKIEIQNKADRAKVGAERYGSPK